MTRYFIFDIIHASNEREEMKISELIARLQKIAKDRGDCKVYIDNVYGADIGVSFENGLGEYFDEFI